MSSMLPVHNTATTWTPAQINTIVVDRINKCIINRDGWKTNFAKKAKNVLDVVVGIAEQRGIKFEKKKMAFFNLPDS